MVSKFPVVSESGNEYKVSVYEECGVYIISIYVQKKLFGKWNYNKFVSGGRWYGRYSMKEWKYDIMRCVRHRINQYESENVSSIEHKKNADNSFKKFEEWDGIIK